MRTEAFKDWRTRVRRAIWVSPGEPKNLVSVHNEWVQLAMIEIGKAVECVQQKHTNVYPACSTYVQCAKTLLELPIGIIHKLYTISGSDFCDRVYYGEVSSAELNCMARNLITKEDWTAPGNVGMQALQQGIKFAEASTDSTVGRAQMGVWAKERGLRIAMFPWIQSNESVVIEWDGFKTNWLDDDILDLDIWSPEHFEAVKTFTRWKHEDLFGTDPGLKRDLKMQWFDQRADLIYECEKRLRERETQVCCPGGGRLPTKAELDDDAVPEVESDEVTFAVIADYGQDTAGELAVANLVKSWNPAFILANGDCDYIGDYDVSNGKYYQEFISPYSGAYGSGAADGVNKFFPTPANHDWDADGIGATTLAKYLAFFTLPGNERYYELVRGPMHIFMLSSDVREPDGNTLTSKQAEWLRAKLQLSPARWKLVFIHDAPYTSNSNGDAPGILTSRWPFKPWGADVVASGDAHQYERFEVDGLPYVVCGAGGAALVPTFVDPPTTGSLVRYAANYAALKIVCDCDSLTIEAINIEGTVIDTLTLTK